MAILLLFISVLAFSLIVYYMPKHLTKLEMYATSLFAAVLQLLTDTFLEFKYDLYGYFTEGVDWITLWVIFIVYPCVNIIFLNFFPSQGKLSDKGLYIIAWSAFAVVYEWIAVHTEYFYYNEWELLYSVPIYPVLYFLLFLNWRFIQKLASS